MSLLHLFVVSTHSRPKAAGCGQKPEPKPPMRFQHTAARRRLVSNISTATASACFNTQPPEGGWFILAGKIILYWLFQHTAARRRLGGLAVLFGILLVFQHTAARRRLDFRDGKVVVFGRVSTHSRPKAAGCNDCFIRGIYAVSTHSRPKAAGEQMADQIESGSVSTHSRPKAAGGERRHIKDVPEVSTHSRPKAAGSSTSHPAYSFWFQHTAARRRLGTSSIWPKPWTWFQHTAARRRLGPRPLGRLLADAVSTHSRPKAAGHQNRPSAQCEPSFNTQPPEGGWSLSQKPCSIRFRSPDFAKLPRKALTRV